MKKDTYDTYMTFFKHITLLLLFIFSSCSHVTSWKYDMLSFWSYDNLKTYAFLYSDKTWVACNIENFPEKSLKQLKEYLSEIVERSLTNDELNYCALYRCSKNRDSLCVNEGSYSVFSEVVKDLVYRADRYTSKNRNSFNWGLEESNCLSGQDLNSCSIVSTYHRFRSKDRKKFYEIRKKECSLLSINETDCSYDF